jgi:type IV pilus assembly protein PilN
VYKVNLLPPKLQREGTIDVRRLLIISGVTLLIAVFVAGYGTFILSIYSMRTDIAATEQQLASLAPAVARAEAVRAQRVNLEASLKEYKDILGKQQSWSGVLFDLGAITPVDLWLVELEIGNNLTSDDKNTDQKSKEGSSAKGAKGAEPAPGAGAVSRPNMVVLKGFSRTVPSIGVFVDNLCRLPCFEEVRLKKISAETDGNKFEITALLREGR